MLGTNPPRDLAFKVMATMKIAIVAPLVSAIREPQGGGSQAFVSDLAAGWRAGDTRSMSTRPPDRRYRGSRRSIPGSILGLCCLPCTGPLALRPRDQAKATHAFARVYSLVRQTRYDVVHNHAFDAPAIRLASSAECACASTHCTCRQSPLSLPRSATPPGDGPAASCGRRVRIPGESLEPGRQCRRDPAAVRADPRHTLVARAGDGAIFAGRLSPEKGAAEAIDIARLAGMKIDVYGDAYDPDYAREQIDPRRDLTGVAVHPAVASSTALDGDGPSRGGSVPGSMGRTARHGCRRGAGMRDSGSCLQRGGLGEMIAHGVSGFLVAPDDRQGAADSIARVSRISRTACRRHAERYLDLERSLDAT